MAYDGRLSAKVVHLRAFWAALPAIALIGGGMALTTQADLAGAVKNAHGAKDVPVIVVPRTAVTLPAIPEPVSTGPAPGVAPLTPALALPAGTAAGSSTPVALDRSGIPARALAAYRKGASLVSSSDRACHVDWALLGAIGRVESNHARFGGNQLDAAGVAQPGIIGIALNGMDGTARISDTDRGLLDRDTVYDRAVGPMQFIPGTWRAVGVDATGDGVKNPQDMVDAATSTAVYLCSGPGDLRRPADLHAAVMRYNPSDSYVRTVTAIAAAYRHGVSTLPASALPAARPELSGGAVTTSGTARLASSSPTPANPAQPTGTSAAGQQPAATGTSTSASSAGTSTPGTSSAATSTGTATSSTGTSTPATSTDPTTVPPTTVPPTTVPPTTVPPTTVPPTTVPPTVPPTTVPPTTVPPTTDSPPTPQPAP